MGKKNDTSSKQQERRKALKIASSSAIVAAAATQLPKEWKKPAIDSIVLPAHAATTEDMNDPVEVTTTVETTSAPDTTPGTTIPSTGAVGNAGNAGNASDIRLKSEVEPLARTPDGLQLYRFQYKKDPLGKTHVGLMAQDLLSSHPEALNKNSDGYFLVRYDLLGLKMASLEEWDQNGIDSVLLTH